MTKITVSSLALTLYSGINLVLFCSLMWITILLIVSTSIQAEEKPEDFTLLSIEKLLEVKTVRNAVNILHSHIHKRDDWMVGYHYMRMEMDGNRDGTADVSTASILANFPITPLSMSMQSHMFHLMYAPSDDLTVMAMLPYKILSMDHVTRAGVSFTTRAEGIGDLSVMSHYVLYRAPQNKQLFSLQAGLSFPTGSIDKRDTTPAGASQKLPYPMQLGSGTYDLKLGADFQYFKDDWLFAVNSIGTIRFGENDEDYRLGNILEIGSWATYGWSDWLSTTLHLSGKSWGNVSGADPELNPALISTADPDRRGGTRIDALIDVELVIPNGNWQNNSFGIEFGMPIYQNLEGPQLETDWIVSMGWQWVF